MKRLALLNTILGAALLTGNRKLAAAVRKEIERLANPTPAKLMRAAA
jgi:hypothetical protein